MIRFEEYLEKYGSLTYRNTGISMLPLLREGKDLFTVTRMTPGIRCRVHDVILFRRKENYVLHRVVQVMDNGYWTLGDNCVNQEYVPEEDVLGVMQEVIRDGKQISVTDPGYVCYVRLWTALYPVRRVYMRVKAVLYQWIKRENR